MLGGLKAVLVNEVLDRSTRSCLFLAWHSVLRLPIRCKKFAWGRHFRSGSVCNRDSFYRLLPCSDHPNILLWWKIHMPPVVFFLSIWH